MSPRRATPTADAGRWAEDLALGYLLREGLKLEGRNYRCRQGEIDLVMAQNEVLVFVEVRYRSHPGYGGGVQSVDWRKRRRLLAAARHYLQRHPGSEHRPCRFDVVSISGEQQASDLRWVADAFGE